MGPTTSTPSAQAILSCAAFLLPGCLDLWNRDAGHAVQIFHFRAQLDIKAGFDFLQSELGGPYEIPVGRILIFRYALACMHAARCTSSSSGEYVVTTRHHVYASFEQEFVFRDPDRRSDSTLVVIWFCRFLGGALTLGGCSPRPYRDAIRAKETRTAQEGP